MTDEAGVELVPNWGSDMAATEGEFDMPQRDAYLAGHMAWEELDPEVQAELEADAKYAIATSPAKEPPDAIHESEA